MAIVIRTRGADPAALEVTLAAIRATAPDVAVLTAEDAGAIEALGREAPHTFVVFLEAGDRPLPGFLERLAASAGPQTKILSFDLFRNDGAGAQPLFLPGANPVLLQARDYLFSRAAVRADQIRSAASVRDTILAWCAAHTVEEVRAGWRHVAEPLLCAAVTDGELQRMAREALSRMHRAVVAPACPPVSAIICTRDKGHLTRQLVRSLLAIGPESLAEVVIVSNGTANPYALQALADLAAASRVRVVRDDGGFNFSRLSNFGAAQSRGRGPLLFINDDIVPVSEGWLPALTSRLQTPGAGAVGPLLLYPREQVQHAGMQLRRLGGAGHILRGASLPEDDYLCLASTEREVSCLTGAVLLTDRSLFERLGGFDEALPIALQDVDYCLKIHRAGLRSIFEPRAVLLHMESTSIAGIVENPEVAKRRYDDWRLFMDRWGALAAADPFGLPGFDPEDESLRRLARK